MQIRRRLALATALIALLTCATLGTARADATQGRNAITLSVTCAGQELTIVSPSEPTASAQVLGSTSTLVVTDVTLTTAYTDPLTGEPVTDSQTYVFGAGHGPAQGLQGRLITCTHTDVVQDPNVGPITVTFVGMFLMTPQP